MSATSSFDRVASIACVSLLKGVEDLWIFFSVKQNGINTPPCVDIYLWRNCTYVSICILTGNWKLHFKIFWKISAKIFDVLLAYKIYRLTSELSTDKTCI